MDEILKNGCNREKLSEILSNALENIREIADVDTVIGTPIETANGTTVIPVSNVSLGFASGGVDDLGKKSDENKIKKVNFCGGGGTGIKLTPVGFLVVKPDGIVEFISATAPAPSAPAEKADTIVELIERSPEIIKKVKNIFVKDGKKKDGKDGKDGENAENDDAAPAEAPEGELTEGENKDDGSDKKADKKDRSKKKK